MIFKYYLCKLVLLSTPEKQRLEFEHRDLHWGNVLVAHTEASTIKYTVDGVEYEVETCGVHANIIDYTLSRLESGMPGIQD